MVRTIAAARGGFRGSEKAVFSYFEFSPLNILINWRKSDAEISSIYRSALANAPKNFQLITSQGTIYNINKTIIYYSSKTIRYLIDSDSTISSYQVQIESESVVNKFASILNGNSEAFSKEEKQDAKQFSHELDIEGFPHWLQLSQSSSSWNRRLHIKNPALFPISISPESFLLFIQTERINPLNVTFQTKFKSYQVPLFGAFSSSAFIDFYNNLDSTQLDKIVFQCDIDDPNNYFEEIANLISGGDFLITAAKQPALLQFSQVLRMPLLTEYIELVTKEFEERRQIFNRCKHYFHPTDEMVSKFLSMKPPTSTSPQKVFEYIVESGWLNDDDHIMMLISILSYVSLFHVKIQDKIIDIIELIIQMKPAPEPAKFFLHDFIGALLGENFTHRLALPYSNLPMLITMLKRKMVHPAEVVFFIQGAGLGNQYHLQKPIPKNYNHFMSPGRTNFQSDNSFATSDSFFTTSYFTNLQYYFYPELKSTYKSFYEFDLNIDDSMRTYQGLEGSLKRYIYDDDIDKFKEYVQNHPYFEFTQKITIPFKQMLETVTPLEFAAIVESPKVFNYILSQSPIIEEGDTLMKKPAYLTSMAASAALGNPEMGKNIQPYLKALLPTKLQSRSAFMLRNTNLLISAIYKHDFEAFKFLFNPVSLFDSTTVISEAINSFNSEVLDYIFNNIFFPPVPQFPFSANQYNDIFAVAVHNTDYFKVLIEIFGDFVLVPARYLESIQNRYECTTSIYSFIGLGTTEVFKIMYNKCKEKNIGFPVSFILKSASRFFLFNIIQFLIETEHYQLQCSELPIILLRLNCSQVPISKYIYEHVPIKDDNLIYFIEYAAQNSDKLFLSMLIEKQFKINPKSTFERVLNAALLSVEVDVEIVQMISNLKVDNDDSYSPIVNINEIDYLTTLTILVRRTMGSIARENMPPLTTDTYFKPTETIIELIKLLLKFLKGADLESAVKRILTESIAITNNEIASFALSYKFVTPHIFIMACYNNMLNVVKACVEICPTSSFYNYSDRYGTGLYVACKQGNEDIVDFLLGLPDIQISTDPSPLVSAAFSRNYNIFIKLIKKYEFTQQEINLALLSYIKATNAGILYPPSSTPEYTSKTSHPNVLSPNRAPEISCYRNTSGSNKDMVIEFPEYAQQRDGGSNSFLAISLISLIDTPKLEDKEEFLSFFFKKNDKHNCELDADIETIDKYRNMIDYHFHHNNETFLIVAANMGRTEIVRLLLQNPLTNVNEYDNNGNTALIHAVFNGHLDIVQLLCELRPNDIDVNHENFFKRTALTFASHINRFDIFDYLTQQKSFDYDKSHIETAVAASILVQNTHFVQTLLDPSKYDFDINKLVYFSHPLMTCFNYNSKGNDNRSNGFGVSAPHYESPYEDFDDTELGFSNLSLIYIAYLVNDLMTIRLLASHPRFDKDFARNEFNNILRNPKCTIQFLNEILKISGYDINFTYQGRSLLFNSILNSSVVNPTIPNYILDSPNFDPVQSNVNDCFFAAIRMDNIDLIKKLVKFDGIKYNEPCPSTIDDSIFLSKGVYPKAADHTPLSIGVISSPELFAFFISLPNIDINARDIYGSTPIFHAYNSHLALITLLKYKNLDINAQDDAGRTPLMHFISHRAQSTVIAAILARKDIDLSIKDKEGRNAIQYIDSQFDKDPKSLSNEEILDMYQENPRPTFTAFAFN